MQKSKGYKKNKKYGVVVMIDALGAKGFTLEASNQFLLIRQNFLDKLNKKYEDICSIKERLAEKDIGTPKIMTFGDTIVLSWPLPKKKPERFLPLLAEWLRPSVMVGLTEGLLFRGALSIGDYIHDGETIIGPAISDAASWYEMADWIGIIATPSCGYKLSLLNETLKKQKNNIEKWYCEYVVPLKTGKSHKMWTVSWPAQYPKITNDLNGVTGNELFFYFLSEFPVPIGTEQKYANTVSYFNWFRTEMALSVQKQEE